MSDLAVEALALLRHRGLDPSPYITDDLMTLINQGVIKAENKARALALQDASNIAFDSTEIDALIESERD